MTVTVTTSGERVEDTIRRKVLAAVDVIVPMIVGIIQRRTAKGIDRHGATFKPYAAATRERYLAMGEGLDVDLTLTGGYLKGISERSRVWVGTSLVITIGPGTGTSPQVAPPTKGKPRSVDTGKRSPPHNVLGRYLEEGTPRMPARPHLGLTPEETKRVGAKFRQLLNT